MTMRQAHLIFMTILLTFAAGFYLGTLLTERVLKNTALTANITRFTWLQVNMPEGWLWWAAFVIIGTVWVTR